MAKNKKIIYYEDELNDDFAGGSIKKRTIDDKYKFIHKNPFWKLIEFILYYIIAYPLIWFFMRCILCVKFVNLKAIKKHKGTYYLYGCHTDNMCLYVF